MRPKTGRAEQIFKSYPTTGRIRGKDSFKILLDHFDGLKGFFRLCSKFGQKNFFLSVKILGKVGIIFFIEKNFFE